MATPLRLPPWPQFTNDEIDAVVQVLKSGKVNQWTGSQVKIFQERFAAYSSTKYAVAFANGSVSLTAAYLALGLESGHEFITTPRSFVATAMCGALLGAEPVFADVDPSSGNITAASIEPLITSKTKLISVVHLAGWPADMPAIIRLARSYNITVVEDCAQSHGASIGNSPVGCFADISSWSFCQDKIMTTGGEGGMVATNNPELEEKLWSLKDHGKNRTKIARSYTSEFNYVHDKIGTNLRLTECQAAIGVQQLLKLDHSVFLRARNASILDQYLTQTNLVECPPIPSEYTHAYYKYYCYLNIEYLQAGWSRRRIISEISEQGFAAFSGSCSEVFRELCFSGLLSQDYSLPNARNLGSTSLMFLVHPTIDESTMHEYAQIILSVLKKAER